MIATIPNELFNSIDVHMSGSSDVRIVDYLGIIALKLPNCSDVAIAREFWNAVCDFSERCGAMREKQTGTLDASRSMTLAAPTHGDFQRFVGAELSGSKVSVTKVSFSDTATYPKATFADGASGDSASLVYSVIPDVNAQHDVTKVGTSYPNDHWKAPAWFLKAYQKILVAGALFRLFGMTGKPWTDFNAARSNALVYNREINRVSHGLITAGMRKQALAGPETAFIGNAQQAQVQQQPQQ